MPMTSIEAWKDLCYIWVLMHEITRACDCRSEGNHSHVSTEQSQSLGAGCSHHVRASLYQIFNSSTHSSSFLLPKRRPHKCCVSLLTHRQLTSSSPMANEKFGVIFTFYAIRSTSRSGDAVRLWHLPVRAYHDTHGCTRHQKSQPGRSLEAQKWVEGDTSWAMGVGAKIVCTLLYDHFSAIRGVFELPP